MIESSKRPSAAPSKRPSNQEIISDSSHEACNQGRDSQMRYGTVVQYFPAKGFGFIRPDLGPDVFFHITALGNYESQPPIEPGQPVKYELEARPGPKSRSREDSAKPRQLRARLVELIDKIPGAILEETAEQGQSARHPRARRKKPGWRR
jgi:cold shock CspA family protein